MVLLAASGRLRTKLERTKVFDLIGVPGEIQTPDSLVRDQALGRGLALSLKPDGISATSGP